MKTNYPRLKKNNYISRAATTGFQQVRGNKSNGFCYWYLKLKRFTHSYPLERDWFQDSVACMCTQWQAQNTGPRGPLKCMYKQCHLETDLSSVAVQLQLKSSQSHQVHQASLLEWTLLLQIAYLWFGWRVMSQLLVLLINSVSHTWVLSHYKQH